MAGSRGNRFKKAAEELKPIGNASEEQIQTQNEPEMKQEPVEEVVHEPEKETIPEPEVASEQDAAPVATQNVAEEPSPKDILEARLADLKKTPTRKERMQVLLTKDNMDFIDNLLKDGLIKSKNDFINILIEEFRKSSSV